MGKKNETDLLANPMVPNGAMFYAEVTGQTGSSAHSFAFQQDNSQHAFPIDVLWEEFVDYSPVGTVPRLLGYNTLMADIGHSLTTIHRVLPWQSPYYPWMWASGLSNVHGLKFLGKIGANGGVQTKWDRARPTVTFTARSYDVLSDDQLLKAPADGGFGGKESFRYVTYNQNPTAEFLTTPPGTFKFVEGLLKNPNTVPVQLGINLLQVKVDLEWTWHNVPHKYLMDDATGRPLNLERGLGCVNDAAFHGYPAGTLLALPYSLKPIEEPVSPLLLGLPVTGPPRAWDVTFRFKFWDPPVGVLGPGQLVQARGHNLAFWWNDMKFYLLQSKGLPGQPAASRRIYQNYNFDLFFYKAVP